MWQSQILPRALHIPCLHFRGAAHRLLEPFRFQSATGLGARGCLCSPVVKAWPWAIQIDPNWAKEGFEPRSLRDCPLPPKKRQAPKGLGGKHLRSSICVHQRLGLRSSPLILGGDLMVSRALQ